MEHITPQKAASNGNKKFLLVQYNISPKTLVHAMITENDVLKPTVLQHNTTDVIIQDGQKQFPANVLLLHENERFMEHKYKKLKNMDMEQIFTGEFHTNSFANDAWVLIQYNCTPFKVAYTILNQRDTFWPGNNLYKDVVTYFRDQETVYQAIVLQKSINIEDLYMKLVSVKEVSKNLFTTVGINPNVDFLSPAKNSPSRVGKYAFFERILRNKAL